ncbi:MAG: hypothetical protein QG567_534 [Campylobacterota bacterium]|nr:hypothetical protein [Campylobacterota bacterium]
MQNKFIQEITLNKKYFIFSLLLSIYIFLPQFFAIKSIESVCFSLISISILFFLSKINKLVFVLIGLATLLINSIVLHIVIHWGGGNLDARLQTAVLSPTQEAFEYLSTYISWFDYFILLYLAAGLFLLYKFLMNHNHSYKLLKSTGLYLLLLLMIGLSSINLIKNVTPFNYFLSLNQAYEWRPIVVERANFLAKQERITYNKPLFYDKIIIIMGESVNRNHMSIYNYPLNTTPFLDYLANQPHGFVFDNVVAPTNQTRYSIPIMLTDATVEHFFDFITSKSLIGTFKEHGYKSYWFSNQYRKIKHDAYIDTIMNEADIIKTVDSSTSQDNANFDMALLEHFEKINISNNEKQIFFLHLLGSHTSYKKRYPANQVLFPNPKNVIEEYDNSIYYTDTVLEKIFNKFKDKFLFIYLSDHGELININKNGHGFIPPYKDEYEIPLFIYSSDKNDRLKELQEVNKNNIFNMESFNELVKYIAGIDDNKTKISNNANVFAVDPTNIFNYKDLEK